MVDEAWAENPGRAVERDQTGMYVTCTSGKGFKAKLRLYADGDEGQQNNCARR